MQGSALSEVACDLFNRGTRPSTVEARRRRESLAHLIQATAEALDDALEASNQLAAKLES